MPEPYFILFALLVIWVTIYIVSLLLPLEKYGLVVTPLYLMYKTERFNGFFDRIAKKNEKLWKILANVGIAAAVVEIFLATYILATNLQRFIYLPQEAGPVVPILPGVTISFTWFPYILVAAGLAITTHEMAHGVVSSAEKIPLKSSGILLAPVTFGGFVEPDEEALDKSPLLSKLRVLAAGSFTNMVTGLLALLLIISLFASSTGVLVMDVPENGPVYGAGMRPWEVIYSINGHRLPSVAEFSQFMVAIGPGVPLTIETSSGLRNIVTEAADYNETKGIIGIRNFLSYRPMRIGEISPQITYHLAMTLEWTSLLMINVAIFNMLPLFPFDGEAFVYSLLKKKLKKELKAARIAVNAFSLLLLLSNIGFTLVMFGLNPFQ